ncbi:hypothetical protein H5T87_07195 [bacterium]|nr:hypothetical protein [bacterium]
MNTKRRKIAIYIGICLSVLLLIIYFLSERYFPKRYYSYIYRAKGGYPISLSFDKEGRLINASYDLGKRIEISGLWAGDTVKEVIRKLGKPRLARGAEAKYLIILRKEPSYFVEAERGKTISSLSLVYYRQGGRMILNFLDGKLLTVQFLGGNASLPEGIRMGMRKKDVEEKLGKLEFYASPRVAHPIFDWFRTIVSIFLVVLVYSLLRERGYRLASWLLFLLTWLASMVTVTIVFEAFEIVRNLALSKAELSSGILPPLHFLTIDLNILPVIGFYPCLLYTCFLFLLDKLSESWTNKSKSAMLIGGLLLVFLVASPLMPKLVPSHDVIVFSRFTAIDIQILSRFIFEYSLLIIWFVFLCPPIALSIKESVPRISLSLNIKNRLGEWGKMAKAAILLEEKGKRVWRVILLFSSFIILSLLFRKLFTFLNKIHFGHPTTSLCVLLYIANGLAIGLLFFIFSALAFFLWEKKVRSVFFIALAGWLMFYLNFSVLFQLFSLILPEEREINEASIYILMESYLIFVLIGLTSALPLRWSDYSLRWLFGVLMGLAMPFYSAILNYSNFADEPIAMFIVGIALGIGGFLGGLISDIIRKRKGAS